MTEIINDGALIGRNPTDYVHGLIGALPYEIRLASGNWIPYVVSGEKQSNYKGDSMSCVSFSNSSIIEVQEKYQTGIEVNYSDRWLAVASGTTELGNYLWKVADTARNVGLVLESAYPPPIVPWTWSQYHAPVPEPLLTQLKVKAADWRAKWDLAYEWIEISEASFTKHLKHAPIQLVFPNHAIGGLALKIEDGMVTYLDSYEPYLKTMHISKFTDALKIVLTSRQKLEPMIFFKVKGKPAIYEFVHESWRGYDDPTSYSKDVAGKTVKVVELDQVEFDKLPQLFPI